MGAVHDSSEDRHLRLRRRRIRSTYHEAWAEAEAVASARAPLDRLKDELDHLLLSHERALEERRALTAAWYGALTPRVLPHIDGVRVASFYDPSNTHIGGDFYDVVQAPDGTWAVSLGDVCGKGTSAATAAALVRHSLRAAAHMVEDPRRALQVAHDVLAGESDEFDPVFCTAAYARLRRAGACLRLRLVLAGHPFPLVRRTDGTVESIGIPGTALGIEAPGVPLDVHEVEVDLRAGETLLLYTDGLTDARNGREFFGHSRLVEVLASVGHMTPRAVVDCIHRAVADFRDDTAQDDIAVLALDCASEAGG